jgi:phage terminase large subunit
MRIPGWTIQRERIFHACGSEITFAGIRTDPRKIKSSEGVDIVWVEEAESVSKASWDILIPTIRKPGSEIWITFNPREKGDPTYTRFVVEPPDNALVLMINWRDNPWFPHELEVERKASALRDPDEYAHIWEGQPKMRRDTQVMANKWQVQTFEPKDSWDGPYYGLDFGFSQDPAFAVEVWRGDGCLWIRREAVAKPGSFEIELDHLGAFLLKTLPGCQDRTMRGDSSRPENIAYLRRHELPLIGPTHKWPGSVEDGVAWLRSHDSIIIHPDCPEMLFEATHWQYKVDPHTGEILKTIIDKFNHGWDSVRYAMDPAIRGNSFSSAKYEMPEPVSFGNPWG